MRYIVGKNQIRINKSYKILKFIGPVPYQMTVYTLNIKLLMREIHCRIVNLSKTIVLFYFIENRLEIYNNTINYKNDFFCNLPIIYETKKLSLVFYYFNLGYLLNFFLTVAFYIFYYEYYFYFSEKKSFTHN